MLVIYQMFTELTKFRVVYTLSIYDEFVLFSCKNVSLTPTLPFAIIVLISEEIRERLTCKSMQSDLTVHSLLLYY